MYGPTDKSNHGFVRRAERLKIRRFPRNAHLCFPRHQNGRSTAASPCLAYSHQPSHAMGSQRDALIGQAAAKPISRFPSRTYPLTRCISSHSRAGTQLKRIDPTIVVSPDRIGDTEPGSKRVDAAASSWPVLPHRTEFANRAACSVRSFPSRPFRRVMAMASMQTGYPKVGPIMLSPAARY